MLLSFSMVRRGKPLAPCPFPRRRQGRGQAGVSSFSVLLPNGLALGPLGQGGGHRVHRLGGGEAVSVTLPDPEPVDVAPQDIPLEVVYEDEDVIVVNKPVGMVVHPAASFRHIAVQSGASITGISLLPPHDHLGEVIGPLLPSGNDNAQVLKSLRSWTTTPSMNSAGRRESAPPTAYGSGRRAAPWPWNPSGKSTTKPAR